MKLSTKNGIIVLVLLLILTSGCLKSAEVTQTETQREDTLEQEVEDIPQPESTIQQTEANAKEQNLNTLKEFRQDLVDQGYNVKYANTDTKISDINSKFSNINELEYLVIYVDTREDARYDIVDMAVIATKYFDNIDVVQTKSDDNSLSSSSGLLRSSYFVDMIEVRLYAEGIITKNNVKVSTS